MTNRGGKGVRTLNITDKTGLLIAIKTVMDSDDLMIINKSGITIRMPVKDLRVMGRATQGVRLIRLADDDEIASVAKVEEVLTIDENEYLGTIPTDESPFSENGSTGEDQNNTQSETEGEDTQP